MIICGVDPGLANCGLASIVVNGSGKCVYQYSTTVKSKLGGSGPEVDACLRIAEGACIYVREAHAVAMEYGSWPRSYKANRYLGLCSGVICGLLDRSESQLIFRSPQRIRQLLEVRDSSKEAVVRAIRPLIRNFPRKKLPQHEYDAMAAALAVAVDLGWLDESEGAL
jgi:Holliday junction resolvasome RuvABC endonuclease subunit